MHDTHPRSFPRSPRTPRPGARGFTLIELLVALSVFGLVLAFGVPGFNELAQSQRVSSHANDLIGALQLARSEAVRLGLPVSVSASGDGFAAGWCVHRDASCEEGTVIREHPAVRNLGVAANASRIGFDGRGARVLPDADVATAEISIAPAHCRADSVGRVRVVSVGLSGRASIARANCS